MTAPLKRSLVEHILNHAPSFDWSLQGFGMLRLYLDDGKRFRLHVWDSRFMVPGVSLMHTHPWDFWSFVVAGRIENHEFASTSAQEGQAYNWQRIKCGEGGGPVGMSGVRNMKVYHPAIYTEGCCYSQLSHDVHVSAPQDGTVTIVERTFKEDQDHADVYWSIDREWVSAEPRQATTVEVMKICSNALEKWF